MGRLFPALILAFCGLAATADARPRTVPDRLESVAPDGVLRLDKAGTAVLAGIHILNPEAATATLGPLREVEVKTLGTDRYGRARVLLYTPGAPQPVQEQLLRKGSAVAYDSAASPKLWRAAEASARAAKRGAWSDAAWQATPETVGPEVGAFRLVTGQVTRTYKARDAYYVNFGDDWKTDFSAMVPRRAWRAFGEALEVPVGTRLQVRGTIVSENGPMIVVTRPEQMERVDAKP